MIYYNECLYIIIFHNIAASVHLYIIIRGLSEDEIDGGTRKYFIVCVTINNIVGVVDNSQYMIKTRIWKNSRNH